MAEFFADPDNSSDYAQPKYYAQWDSDNWVVAPTPDQAYALTMAYIKKPGYNNIRFNNNLSINQRL